MEGAWMGSSGQYGYNGIEYENFLDLEMNLATYRGLDPALGRWGQVDPKAEALYGLSPYNSMGNNPISNVDPEGDLPFLAVVGIGAATGIFGNGLSNISQGNNFFDGAGKAAFWGGIGAAASLGVGTVFGATGTFAKELGRAGAHALTQGGMSAAQGGSFWQGALSGGISSGIGSGIDALGGRAGHQILGGGLGGGIGSSIGGGNFFNGFSQGVAVGAFNHALNKTLYDWKTPNKYKALFQGEDPTCLLACGASITDTSIEKFKNDFEAIHGAISADGTNIGLFIDYMQSLGYNFQFGPIPGRIGFTDIGENLQKGHHTIATYPENDGNHSVLVTRIRITKKLDVKMTYINSQIGSKQTSTFPIRGLNNIKQFWK